MLFEKQLNYFFSFLGFLLLNFTGLAIGALWTDPGVSSLWYDGVIKAPWTPPGWVFGFSWTFIMVCFSILFANLYSHKNSKYNQLIALTWILNISWNPLFFTLHWVWTSSLVIVTLTLLIGVLIHRLRSEYKYNWIWVLPYFVWLNIASSLNLFVALIN